MVVVWWVPPNAKSCKETTWRARCVLRVWGTHWVVVLGISRWGVMAFTLREQGRERESHCQLGTPYTALQGGGEGAWIRECSFVDQRWAAWERALLKTFYISPRGLPPAGVEPLNSPGLREEIKQPVSGNAYHTIRELYELRRTQKCTSSRVVSFNHHPT